MKLVHKNWYGFDIKKLNEKFTGDITYVGCFNINSEYQVTSVYKAANPDTSKGHKEYMLLTKLPQGSFVIRGMSKEQLKKSSKREGLHCLKCDEVIYSAMRHDYTECSCKNCFIDGGNDYERYGATDMSSVKTVTINLLTGKIK